MKNFRKYLSEYYELNPDIIGKLILTLTVLLFIYLLQKLILRIIWGQTNNIKTRYHWKRSLSFTLPFLGLFLTGIIWIDAFEHFGAFLGLLTAGIAIALKDPLTNLAGWFFIIFRHPFIVGDRIQIGDHAGDVIDIRLFQFTLLEIGNWVDADQSTGRIIHIPNGKVFFDAQANYSSEFNYIWNEIPVFITFESNWEKAKHLLEDILMSRVSEISKTAEKEIQQASKNYLIYYRYFSPIVYVKVFEYGVKLTMRYLCDPRKRRGIDNEIWQDVLTGFAQHTDIKIAYPTTRFYTRGEELKGRPSK